MRVETYQLRRREDAGETAEWEKRFYPLRMPHSPTPNGRAEWTWCPAELMEILAVIEGLMSVPEGSSAQIYSDSQYVINCMSGAWQKKKNEDLWERLKDVRRGKRIGLTWVRGHNGNSYNERCDALATRGMGLGNKDVDEGYLRQKEESRDF